MESIDQSIDQSINQSIDLCYLIKSNYHYWILKKIFQFLKSFEAWVVHWNFNSISFQNRNLKSWRKALKVGATDKPERPVHADAVSEWVATGHGMNWWSRPTARTSIASAWFAADPGGSFDPNKRIVSKFSPLGTVAVERRTGSVLYPRTIPMQWPKIGGKEIGKFAGFFLLFFFRIRILTVLGREQPADIHKPLTKRQT